MNADDQPPGTGIRRHLTRRNIVLAGLGAVALLLLIQLVPYGHDHSNPPATQAARWTDPAAEQLFSNSCGDCHSNMSDWRWYDKIAPFSWLVERDINGGRERMNVSEWGTMPQPDLGEVTGAIDRGSMPPLQYTLIHRSASLSDAEKQTLVQGLQKLYATDPPSSIRTGGS